MNTYRSSFIQTLKEAPKDAETISHQLMVRAGLIRKVASGIYTVLPMGLRVFKKLNTIIREEMDNIGGIECEMPHLIPAELWKKSDRWDQYGDELLRIKDRSDREFCFGPTHEEVVTDLVSAYTNSYKQLPVLIYQIQTKFRDEIRPRFGMMRGREFLMKDAYSFHQDLDSLNDTYQDCRDAYRNIFQRCGLNFIEAAADSGSIGGDVSSEFLVIADTGEDEVLVAPSIGYAANVEAAKCIDVITNHAPYNEEIEIVETPNIKTISDIATFFNVKTSETLKSIFVVDSSGANILLCLRGDVELNEAKVKSMLGGSFKFASNQELQTVFGCLPGFIGPVSTKESVTIYCDYSLRENSHYIAGANSNDQHIKNLVLDRDISAFTWCDIRNASAGDPCPNDTSISLESQRGIEVGHIFKLGKKYSESMDHKFTKSDGSLDNYEMGCYGIGVGRTIAATIEQSHDQNGIIWPLSLAPFQIVIINLVPKDERLGHIMSDIYENLSNHSIDVIVDDRDESPGIKFKDADLIGFPFQIILGKKSLESNSFELKNRRTGVVEIISLESAIDFANILN